MRPPEPGISPRKDSSKTVSCDAMAGQATSQVARQLGRWNLLKPIARGGMGEVYLATSGGLEGAERPCVLKIIRREHSQDQSFLARFLDEARVQAQLQHHGVVQVLEAATDDNDKPYVVLEYVEGRNLGDLRERAASLGLQLSWADAVAVCVSLGEALVHVHERMDADGKPLHIVHRDLSPHNVMVSYGGDVKLIDFGTARGENRHCQTVSGVVFAKPGYVAPEVANNTPGGTPADLYALGIILWELIMGRRFLTGDPAKHLTQVAAGKANPPAVSLTQNVPLELDTLIARLTAPRLEDRYASARDALHDLVRTLKRAPSLADGERSVRGRLAHLMTRLYPAEPARSRAEFSRLVAAHRKNCPPAAAVVPSPEPTGSASGLLAGTRYRLDRELAHHDMSVVFEATHVDLDRKVALKVLPKEHCDNPEFERRFREEARSLARLRHPNVVQLHDFGVTQDARPFYAMEFLQGVTLKKHAESKSLEWAEAVRLGTKICEALEAAHAINIVHRDVKPGNVFITQGDGVKVIDFGIAQTDASTCEDETESLRVNGTVEYMAPEQMKRGPVDGRADIYALGTILYELVTGQLPFQEDNTVRLLGAKEKGELPAPSQVCPARGIPRALDKVLLRALSPIPEDRYTSALDFHRALSRTLTQQQRTRRRWQAIGVAAGVTFATLGLNQVVAAQKAFAWLEESPAPATSPLLETNRERERAEIVTLSAAELAAKDAHAITTIPKRQAAVQAPVAPLPAGQVTAKVAKPASPAIAETDNKDDSVSMIPSLSEADKLKITAEVTRISRLMLAGKVNVLKALDRARKLGETHPQDGDILEVWSKAAAKGKWWGESLRVAIRWAAQDKSERAQLHLARTQRLVGQRYSAIQTLKRFLEETPKHGAATAMLQRYRKD